jgi:hypothetical protein
VIVAVTVAMLMVMAVIVAMVVHVAVLVSPVHGGLNI